VKNERKAEQENETATIQKIVPFKISSQNEERKKEGEKTARKGVRRQWVLSPTKEKTVKERDYSRAFRQKKLFYGG